MSVELGHKHFMWEMYIAPIGDDFLLGCDMVDELDNNHQFQERNAD